MYYRDLQPYQYGLPVELPDVVTVGWLSSSSEFDVGKLSQEILDSLKQLLVNSRVNKARGYQLCEFCQHADPVKVELPGGPLILGSAEIWFRQALLAESMQRRT